MKKKAGIKTETEVKPTTAFTSVDMVLTPPSEVSISSGDESSWSYFESKYIFNEDQEESKQTSPERVMFIAVFLQSLLDATKPEYEGEPRLSVANRDCAIKWFTQPACVTASTFEPICELAGINPEYARNYFSLIMEGEREFTYRRINILLNSTKT
jgi:hypothetical protein